MPIEGKIRGRFVVAMPPGPHIAQEKIRVAELAAVTTLSKESDVNKVVARFVDGRIVKGTTADFLPTKDMFHLNVMNEPVGTKPIDIRTNDLKALFFVKNFAGDAQYVDSKEFDPSRPPAGRKIRVEFTDGEVLVGTTTGYQPGRPGFFLVPADAGSNIERCYVVAAATKSVSFV